MTDLPYGADTIVIPFTIIPSPSSRPAPPARTPSTSEQSGRAPDRTTPDPSSS